MKSIFALSFVLLSASFAKADGYVDVDPETIRVVNFVTQCLSQFQNKKIKSAVKGTFAQGIVMSFKTTEGETIEIRWEAKTKTYHCQ